MLGTILYPSLFILIYSIGLIMMSESISTSLKLERVGGG